MNISYTSSIFFVRMQFEIHEKTVILEKVMVTARYESCGKATDFRINVL